MKGWRFRNPLEDGEKERERVVDISKEHLVYYVEVPFKLLVVTRNYIKNNK